MNEATEITQVRENRSLDKNVNRGGGEKWRGLENTGKAMGQEDLLMYCIWSV